MTRLDLPESQVRGVVALLRSHLPDAEVWAYGSRVSGTAHETSDLDLVVRHSVSPAAIGNLRVAFAESRLPISVDIHDWNSLPDAYRIEIERSHVVLVPTTGGELR